MVHRTPPPVRPLPRGAPADIVAALAPYLDDRGIAVLTAALAERDRLAR
ncbi:MAG: hypothetical protein R3F59_27690 [Myxococcota bacterium]